jgi:hypothetical protein
MTRNGKIARLSQTLREQVNTRLADNQPADEILAWLTALPEAQAVLARNFRVSWKSERPTCSLKAELQTAAVLVRSAGFGLSLDVWDVRAPHPQPEGWTTNGGGLGS